MGVYVHFTDDQKCRANNVDLVDFLQRHGEKLLPSGRDKRLASDHSITPQRKAGMPLTLCGSFMGSLFPKP